MHSYNHLRSGAACGAILLLATGAAQPAPAVQAGNLDNQDHAGRRPEPQTAMRDDAAIRITKQARDRVDPLQQDAWRAYRNGRFDEAGRLYQALLKRDARHVDALLGLAAIALQQGDGPAAARHYARVLELDPRNASANAGLAMLQPDDEAAISRIKMLLREQDDAAILHFALGNLYAAQQRWSEARQAYASARLLEPGNAGFAFNLAVSLDHLEQDQAALRHYRAALQLDPEQHASLDHAQIEQRIADLGGQTP